MHADGNLAGADEGPRFVDVLAVPV
ncbi:hypothetical protein ACTIVE_0346 [Actinomadura verrucosospora]|uniref:Uncharacterized protein n=1 Tax=Actinomadura verrucosospora TaxID=46165 RepID=A0A7D3VTM4_ACTVE|nr:hypothetical protein ACTIVE_0346 [Actinomadura verrucosospora]